MYAPLPLSPRRLGTSLRVRGKRTTKEERNYIFHYLNTLFQLFYAGFFTKSQIMFFLLSSFRFLPPLKNDGRGELCFWKAVSDFLPKQKRIRTVGCPRLSGKVAVKPSEGTSVSRKVKTVFYKTVLNTCPSFLNEVMAKDTGINTLTCVRRLAPIASQARHFPPYSGEADN